MLTYSTEERGGLPLYEYLYRCIRGDILSGTLAAGERLPSKRRLAEHLQLSVITVEGAYSSWRQRDMCTLSPSGAFSLPRWSGWRRPRRRSLCRPSRKSVSGGWT